MGVGLVIGFTELLQLVTTSKDYVLTVLHTSQVTTDTLYLLSLLQSSYPLLGSGSKADVTLPLGSLTVPSLRYQLLTATAHNN
jgi:hypothetical protein